MRRPPQSHLRPQLVSSQSIVRPTRQWLLGYQNRRTPPNPDQYLSRPDRRIHARQPFGQPMSGLKTGLGPYLTTKGSHEPDDGRERSDDWRKDDDHDWRLQAYQSRRPDSQLHRARTRWRQRSRRMPSSPDQYTPRLRLPHSTSHSLRHDRSVPCRSQMRPRAISSVTRVRAYDSPPSSLEHASPSPSPHPNRAAPASQRSTGPTSRSGRL